MLKVSSEGSFKLDYILAEDGTAAKVRRIFRDCNKVKVVFETDAVVFGGWATQLLCPTSVRKHHDLDIFLSIPSYKPKDIKNFEAEGYKRISLSSFYNQENDVIDLFGHQSSKAFVITTVMDPKWLFADSITLLLKEENAADRQKSGDTDTAQRSLDEFVGAEHKIPQITTYKKQDDRQTPEMCIKVPSPVLQIVLKARSYASRKAEQDSKDLIALVDRYYGGDLCRLFKEELLNISKANGRFSYWLNNMAKFEDPELLFNMTSGSRSKKVKRTVALYSSRCHYEINAAKDISVAIISAYYKLHPADICSAL